LGAVVNQVSGFRRLLPLVLAFSEQIEHYGDQLAVIIPALLNAQAAGLVPQHVCHEWVHPILLDAQSEGLDLGILPKAVDPLRAILQFQALPAAFKSPLLAAALLKTTFVGKIPVTAVVGRFTAIALCRLKAQFADQTTIGNALFHDSRIHFSFPILDSR
jgi:hypothetical protein